MIANSGINSPLENERTNEILENGLLTFYRTFLGGDEEECGTGVAVDGDGRVYLTRSDNFPLALPLQETRSGETCNSLPCSDAFISETGPDHQ